MDSGLYLISAEIIGVRHAPEGGLEANEIILRNGLRVAVAPEEAASALRLLQFTPLTPQETRQP